MRDVLELAREKHSRACAERTLSGLRGKSILGLARESILGLAREEHSRARAGEQSRACAGRAFSGLLGRAPSRACARETILGPARVRAEAFSGLRACGGSILRLARAGGAFSGLRAEKINI